MNRFDVRLVRGAAVLLLCFLSGCGEDTLEIPTARTLRDIPQSELRTVLKGYSGDWRGETPSARGLPSPPTALTAPEGAVVVALPPVNVDQATNAFSTLVSGRRSHRAFTDQALTLKDLSFLLWATQGRTDEADGLRAAPSGGGRFPLNTWVVAQRVDGLKPGVYGYLPDSHALWQKQLITNPGGDLVTLCYGQAFVGDAACTFVWSAVPARTEWKYGYIAHRLIAMEAGHVCQNLYLACEALGWGTCGMLGYNQPGLDQFLCMDGEDEFGLYIAPIGWPAEEQ